MRKEEASVQLNVLRGKGGLPRSMGCESTRLRMTSKPKGKFPATDCVAGYPSTAKRVGMTSKTERKGNEDK